LYFYNEINNICIPEACKYTRTNNPENRIDALANKSSIRKKTWYSCVNNLYIAAPHTAVHLARIFARQSRHRHTRLAGTELRQLARDQFGSDNASPGTGISRQNSDFCPVFHEFLIILLFWPISNNEPGRQVGNSHVNPAGLPDLRVP